MIKVILSYDLVSFAKYLPELLPKSMRGCVSKIHVVAMKVQGYLMIVVLFSSAFMIAMTWKKHIIKISCQKHALAADNKPGCSSLVAYKGTFKFLVKIASFAHATIISCYNLFNSTLFLVTNKFKKKYSFVWKFWENAQFS